MVLSDVIINLVYVIYALAFLVRDILWLRILVVLSCLFMVGFGYIADNMSILVWNSLFILINLIQIVRIVIERRPIKLPAYIDTIHHRRFDRLNSREFLFLWKMGESKTFEKGDILVEQGKIPSDLLFVLDGQVKIERNGDFVRTLGKHYFVAEMSFLSQESATADVVADTQVDAISWSQSELNDVEKINPGLVSKFRAILGTDLSKKLL